MHDNDGRMTIFAKKVLRLRLLSSIGHHGVR
jgi:hypothetical protein